MNKEKRQSLIFRLSIITFDVSAVLLLCLIVAQAYVRWSLNKDFSFLGGFGLEALSLLVLGQIIALSYIYRTER
ncbi:MAG: hypothetical protein Q7S08_00960 [bacterium]|nr:hypothetical protein [bacterium]